MWHNSAGIMVANGGTNILETNSGKKGNNIREIEGVTLVKSGTNSCIGLTVEKFWGTNSGLGWD